MNWYEPDIWIENLQSEWSPYVGLITAVTVAVSVRR